VEREEEPGIGGKGKIYRIGNGRAKKRRGLVVLLCPGCFFLALGFVMDNLLSGIRWKAGWGKGIKK
jgi:hypothetical protein